MKDRNNASRTRTGICCPALVLILAAAGAAHPEWISIEYDLIPAPAHVRAEANGICRWRSQTIHADAKSQPHYALIRHDGSVAFRNSFWPAGSVQATVMDMASLESGGAVIAAGAIRTDGAVARGLMVIRADGSTDRFIRTDGFIPRYIAAGADDSIWVIGRATSEAFRQLDVRRRLRSGIARKYSLVGDFLGEFLPLSIFDASSGHPSGKSGKNGRSLLRNLGEGIGFYSGILGEWIEIDASGQLVRRVHLPSAPVHSIAVTDSGRVFSWILGRRFGLYELVSGGATWAPVPGWTRTASARPPVGTLQGAMGEALAFQALPALPNLTLVEAPAPAR